MCVDPSEQNYCTSSSKSMDKCYAAKSVSAAETAPCAHCYTTIGAKTKGTCHRYPSDKTVCVEPSEQNY